MFQTVYYFEFAVFNSGVTVGCWSSYKQLNVEPLSAQVKNDLKKNHQPKQLVWAGMII